MKRQLVLLATLLSSPLQACPAEEFVGQLKDSLLADLPAASSRLFRIAGTLEDLKIHIDSNNSRWLDTPTRLNGHDYVFLDAQTDGPDAEICIYSMFRNSPAGRLEIEELLVDDAYSPAHEVYRRLDEASVNWYAATLESFPDSVDAYADLARSTLTADSLDTSLIFDLNLFAAAGSLDQGNYARTAGMLDAIDRSFPDHPLHYQALAIRGRMLTRQGSLEDAIVALEQSLSMLDRTTGPDPVDTRSDRAEIENWLVEAYVAVGLFDNARNVADIAAQDAQGHFALLGRIYNNMALISLRQAALGSLSREQQLALLESSTAEHLTAAYFSEQAGDREIHQIIENNIAVHYARIGERRKSLIHFLNVIRMLDEFDNPRARAFIYSNLSYYSQALGDYNKAAAFLEQSASYAITANRPNYPNYHCGRGTILLLLEDAASALPQFTECLRVATETGDQMSQAEASLQLSNYYLGLGNISEAEAWIDNAITLLPTTNSFNLEHRTWAQLALIQAESGKLEAALTSVSRAKAFPVDYRYPNDTLKAGLAEILAYQALGLTDQALAVGNTIIVGIESLYRELEAERLGPAWNSQTMDIHSRLAGIYLEQFQTSNDPAMLASAFDMIERSRDVSLRQQLSIQLANESVSLEEQKLLDIYSNIANVLAQSDAGDTLPPMTAPDYYHQHDLLSLARLNNIDRVDIPNPASLSQIQQYLAQDQLALNYMATMDKLYVMAISASSVSLAELGDRAEIAIILQEADASLGSNTTLPYELLHSLSARLLPDLSQFDGVAELLIVPHTGLFTFPFSALSLSPDTDEYIPLINRYTLRTLPSLSAYFMEKPDDNRDYSNQIAVFADPVFGNLQIAGLEAENDTANQLRGWSDSLQSLPYSALEATNIAALFPDSLSFTGVHANRKNLGSPVVRNARILHIATHGYFSSPSEDNTGLALSTIDENNQPDPGFITLSELFGYAFNNELVVISGCETAMGRELDGIGMNGLTRGFLAQGVEHVISTLWPVSDRASAAFMDSFYQHLKSDGRVATALRMAQIELMNDPTYRHPYYWAGYVLTTVDKDDLLDLTNQQ